MMNMTLELAQKAVAIALELSKTELDGRPLSISVCDNDGYLVAFARIDGARLMTVEVSYRKAYTAVRMAVSTDAFLARLQRDSLDIAYFGDPKFTAIPGGVPVFEEGNRIIGAVGIGGLRNMQEDQAIAEKVAAAVSL